MRVCCKVNSAIAPLIQKAVARASADTGIPVADISAMLPEAAVHRVVKRGDSRSESTRNKNRAQKIALSKTLGRQRGRPSYGGNNVQKRRAKVE